MVSGSTVLVSQTTAPSRIPASSPASPSYVPSTAVSSASDTSTTSAPLAASRAVPDGHRLGLVPGAVEDDDGLAGTAQPADHGGTHAARSDEADGHSSSHPPST